MVGPTPFLDSVKSCLPIELLSSIEALCTDGQTRVTLDDLIRFVAGGACRADASSPMQQQWMSNQQLVEKVVNSLVLPSDSKRKRDVEEETDGTSAKKAKVTTDADADDGAPLFTLHSLSASSPVRKKVDITIHQNSIVFTHPTTRTVEARVALPLVKRAFLLPTRGKTKAHWTVVLISSDAPERDKTSPANSQVIFGVDASTSGAFSTTSFTDPFQSSPTAHQKGTETLPLIKQWLSFIPEHALPVIEPSTTSFKSATADSAAVEAYRQAKPGSLWFLREGLLFGENKPCEFWALEDLVGKNEGVRMVSATGRTCSIFIRRKDYENEEEGEPTTEGGEEEGIETEFGMIDGKELEGIKGWVRTYRNLFGKKAQPRSRAAATNGQAAPDGPAAPGAAADESDPEDEDFAWDSDNDDGGSATSSDSSAEEGSRNASDEEEARDSDASAEDGDGEEADEELDEANHPLLQPGAMPRMSRAAIDAVVGMVEDDLMGSGPGPGFVDDGGEEDELED